MKHIFISHAGADSKVAEKLHYDLRMGGHHVRIDLHELQIGDDIIKFINNAIRDSNIIIIIYSENTPSARWQQLEISAAVSSSVNKNDGSIIVLTLGDVQLPPVLGSRRYASIDDDDYKDTVQNLCEQITLHPSDTSAISEALKEESSNPFWRVRAEYFEESDPRLLATSFSPPDAAKIRMLEEMKPCFLEGSRGTGKTMLLLSLRARVLSARLDAKKISDLFGCYVRLERGAFCNAGSHLASQDDTTDIEPQTLARLMDTFAQEFYLGVIESLVSEISHCAKERTLQVDTAAETDLVHSILAAIAQQPSSGSVTHFGSLMEHFANMRRQLSDFVRRRFIYEEHVSVPFTCFDISLFRQITRLVRARIPSLESCHITILLDEYENLLVYQKRVVNTLVKLGPPLVSVKVARKVGGAEVSATTVGQELQETHDYNRVTLIYPVEKKGDLLRYVELLDNMVRRLFDSQRIAVTSLDSFLPSSSESEFPQEDIRAEVVRLVTPKRFHSWDTQKQSEKLAYYRDAAIYRMLAGKRTKKRFAGRKELAYISSGVIRYFQEIVGMAYHLQANGTAGAIESIDPQHQTEAVYMVSSHNLATLSRNVEEHGERLKYFLLDLGDCLRQKLLNHSSEPEAARLALRDPESLSEPEYQLLNTIIDIGIKEGVFQRVEGRPGWRPRHIQDPQPEDVNVARIYAPALEISPRMRWRTEVRCLELLGLLDDRKATKARLIKRFVTQTATKSSDAHLPFGELSGETP